jgi:hypothetical protein
MPPQWLRRLLRTWLLIAGVDFAFATVLSTVFYKSTFARLWQGVASVLVGPYAFNDGDRSVLIGIGLHVCVALTWSVVFLAIYAVTPWIRRVTATRGGVLAVAAVYGPCIWLVMSFGVIHTFTHNPVSLNFRWWVQFFGHIPAVALPIVWSASLPERAEPA